MSVADDIGAGVAAIDGLVLPSGAVARLAAYVELLEKWNRVYNLTAVRDVARMVPLHILDSLAILPLLAVEPGATILDVGTGGGLPGIPIAIAKPDTSVTLLDASSKKTAFLTQAKIELGLENVAVQCDRIEAIAPPRPFDVVISRAFAELADYARVARPVVARTGAVVAMKGIIPHDELGHLGHDWTSEVHPVSVPGLAAQRCLVVMRLAQ